MIIEQKNTKTLLVAPEDNSGLGEWAHQLPEGGRASYGDQTLDPADRAGGQASMFSPHHS